MKVFLWTVLVCLAICVLVFGLLIQTDARNTFVVSGVTRNERVPGEAVVVGTIENTRNRTFSPVVIDIGLIDTEGDRNTGISFTWDSIGAHELRNFEVSVDQVDIADVLVEVSSPENKDLELLRICKKTMFLQYLCR